MVRIVKRKPLSSMEFKAVYGKDSLSDLILLTGARIAEVNRIIDDYEPGKTYVDIRTKKSGIHKNRIYLLPEAITIIKKLRRMGLKNVTTRTMQRHITNASNKIGINFTAHNLRSTFATRLLSNGVDLVSVQHLMNHADIKTTAMYIKLDEIKLRTGLSTLVDEVGFEGATRPELVKEILTLRMRLNRIKEKQAE